VWIFAPSVEAGVSSKNKFRLTTEQVDWLNGKIRAQVYGAISDEAIAQILDRVGHDNVPIGLDREQLKNDIEEAWRFYSDFQRNTSRGEQTQLRSYADKVWKAANALQEILDEESREADIFRYSNLFRNVFLLTNFRIQLQRLPKYVAVFKSFYNNRTILRRALGVSPNEWFFGMDLRCIFEKHFNRPAKRSQGSNKRPDGPYFRFAMAVADAYKVEVGPAYAELIEKMTICSRSDAEAKSSTPVVRSVSGAKRASSKNILAERLAEMRPRPTARNSRPKSGSKSFTVLEGGRVS
jgi:hypothetical protein